jgi:hypothetical protein
MNGLNDTARFLFAGIIGYQLLMTLILGWCLDIRDAFFEIRLHTLSTTFLIFLYGDCGFSPIFIIMTIITIIIIGIQFYNDPRDTHPGSIINIIKGRNTFGYDPNRC